MHQISFQGLIQNMRSKGTGATPCGSVNTYLSLWSNGGGAYPAPPRSYSCAVSVTEHNGLPPPVHIKERESLQTALVPNSYPQYISTQSTPDAVHQKFSTQFAIHKICTSFSILGLPDVVKCDIMRPLKAQSCYISCDAMECMQKAHLC